jgi:hypothetical protein
MQPQHVFLSFIGALLCLAGTPNLSLACRSLTTNQSQSIDRSTLAIDTTESLTPAAPSDFSSWQGQYEFVESRPGNPVSMYTNYAVRISLARCGWRAFVQVNGHLTALDLQAKVVMIDENTIGIDYQQDQYPIVQQPQFKSGDRLLRLQRTGAKPSIKTTEPPAEPTYRVYFDAIVPLRSLYIQPPRYPGNSKDRRCLIAIAGSVDGASRCANCQTVHSWETCTELSRQ